MKSEVEHYENRCGGKGTMHIERLLQSEEMGSGVKMYAKVTIDVDASLGVHQHIGDGESYYILQGRAQMRTYQQQVDILDVVLYNRITSCLYSDFDVACFCGLSDVLRHKAAAGSCTAN